MRGNVAEKRQQRIVILLWNGIDFVVVTARAADGHAEKRLAGGTQNVIEIIVARQRPVGGFIVPNAEPIKTRGRDGVSGFVGQFIAGNLFDDESVVRFVLVEGADNIVAIFPD